MLFVKLTNELCQNIYTCTCNTYNEIEFLFQLIYTLTIEPTNCQMLDTRQKLVICYRYRYASIF